MVARSAQHVDRSWLASLMLLAGIGVMCDVSPAHADPVQVLLTFDVELDEDAAALRRLSLPERATYFVTGQFAERHPTVVAELAINNTIGSHSYSHAHLTQLDEVGRRKELLLSKLILEKVTGRAPVWFRAPYLEYDEDVMKELWELGFRYDSSDQERWLQNSLLDEVAISNDNDSNLLASDYELFDRHQLSHSRALEWLKKQYHDRSATGRPFVFLMHPRIIVKHRDVLNQFVDYVHEQGGAFRTVDEFVEASLAVRPARWGVWVDFSLGEHDPQVVAADIVGAGLTDAFVMVRDPDGNAYYPGLDAGPSATSGRDLFGATVRLLRRSGIRVHAWLPAFRNPYLAQMRPDWAMVASDGSRSIEWLSPSHPEVRAHLVMTIRRLLQSYDLDGIHLDYFRYPGLQYDFGPEALTSIADETRLGDVSASRLLAEHYVRWTDWRTSQIAEVLSEIRDAVVQSSDREITLSAALIADAARSYRVTEEHGQDYAKLAPYLDVIAPMAYFKENQRGIEWIRSVVLAARYKVGSKPLFAGVEGYQEPGAWTLDASQFGAALDAARQGAEGVLVYPYLHLFGRGDADRNMPAEGKEVLATKVGKAALRARGRQAERRDGASRIEPASSQWWRTDQALEVEPSTSPVPFVADAAHAGPTALPNPEEEWAIHWRTLLSASVGASGLGALTAVTIVARRRRRAREQTLLAAPSTQALPRIPVQVADLRGARGYELTSALLRRLGPVGIERCRMALVLDALEQRGEDLAAVIEALSQVPGWRRLTLRYLEESSLLGYVHLDGRSTSITPSGVRELERARADGFDRESWQLIEARIHEMVPLACGRCRSINYAHWLWRAIDCFRCGEKMEQAAATAECGPTICTPAGIN